MTSLLIWVLISLVQCQHRAVARQHYVKAAFIGHKGAVDQTCQSTSTYNQVLEQNVFWNWTARPVIPQLWLRVGLLLLLLKEHLIQQLLCNHLTVNCWTVQLPKVPDLAANCLPLCLTLTQSDKYFPDFNQHSDFFQDEKVFLEAFITTFDLLWERGACRWRCKSQVSRCRCRSDWRLWKLWCWQLLLAAAAAPHWSSCHRDEEEKGET